MLPPKRSDTRSLDAEAWSKLSGPAKQIASAEETVSDEMLRAPVECMSAFVSGDCCSIQDSTTYEHLLEPFLC